MDQPHSCCGGPAAKTASVCWRCGNPGSPVSGITIEAMVRDKRSTRVRSRESFSFCHTPDCPIIYFDNMQREYIEKRDVKVRVGIKETEDPIHVCYCFGWTRKMIHDEIARIGKSSAIDDITTRMKTTGCNCERNNPSGVCCLNDVKNSITAYKHIRGRDDTMKGYV